MKIFIQLIDFRLSFSATKYIVKVLCFTEILLRKVKNSMSTQVHVNKLLYLSQYLEYKQLVNYIRIQHRGGAMELAQESLTELWP